MRWFCPKFKKTVQSHHSSRRRRDQSYRQHMSWKFYSIHIKLIFFSKLEKKRRIPRALISTASMLNTEYWAIFTFNDHFMWCLMCNICTQIHTILFWHFFTRKNHIFFSHVWMWMNCSKPVQVKGPLTQDAVNLYLFYCIYYDLNIEF